ncbi:hypothetical protein BS47DRAFT_1317640 [Hydnum rufescens UP504]|uniref:Rho termination factor N-terminal domain-containing protein n=1 Tax=Hydnum rufescens UP504 TaxID=1448309 RepID=A0A9P6DSK4_9AGAM|nr:hypothetical protein BS47DRAFT_1317640 [Hydnum rufescens UP504]
MEHPDYKKLSVPALKALCKENHIVGYSKLNKLALIDKLTTLTNPRSAPTTSALTIPSSSGISDNLTDLAEIVSISSIKEPTSSIEGTRNVSAIAKGNKQNRASSGIDHVVMPDNFVNLLPQRVDASSATCLDEQTNPGPSMEYFSSTILSSHHTDQADQTQIIAPTLIFTEPPVPTSVPPSNVGDNTMSSIRTPPTSAPVSSNKRKVHSASVDENVVHSKKTKPSNLDRLITSRFQVPGTPMTQSPSLATAKRASDIPSSASMGDPNFFSGRELISGMNSTDISNPRTDASDCASTVGCSRPLRRNLLPPSKPFVPHRPKAPFRALVPCKSSSSKVSNVVSTSVSQVPLHHLNFPMPSEPLPPPQDITLPPRLSQRSLTVRLSIILMYLSDSDRRSCCLVSKAWRYAVYLTAQTILKRHFSGSRLEAYLLPLKGSLAQLNVWSYLRQRQHEGVTRREAYDRSFLVGLAGPHAVSDHLWASPDHERQIVVVLRFILAKLWVASNISDQRVLRWTNSIVVDARPARGANALAEIWEITVCHGVKACTGATIGSGSPVRLEVFWVLAATGEPIGHAPVDPFSVEEDGPTLPLRLDWHTHLSSDSNKRSALIDCIHWTNAEEYTHGISSHWLKTVSQEPSALHIAQKKVAERYILANVAGNSLSGCYQSSAEIARNFQGTPAVVSVLNTRNMPLACLSQSAHHYVESIHFSSRGKPLHPAIAVVMTPAREYYILRDTGTSIGSEESGLYPAWARAIRCSQLGFPDET